MPTPGGSWHSLYRVFLIATEGRVEPAAVGLNPWPNGELRLCVGFLKQERKHHSLQLDVGKYCEECDDGTYRIFHDGRMGGRSLPNEKVLEALVEACRDDLLVDDQKRPIHLGDLPARPTNKWIQTRKTLSNILHYALIRTQLREANTYRESG